MNRSRRELLQRLMGLGAVAALAAKENGRHALLVELNPEYAAMGRRRISQDVLGFD